MALESSIFNAPRFISGTKSSCLLSSSFDRHIRFPAKILEKNYRYPSRLSLNCIGPCCFRSCFSARYQENDLLLRRDGLKSVGEDSESFCGNGVNLEFFTELVKRRIILVAVVCAVLVIGCKKVFAMEGAVNAGYGVIGKNILLLRNGWPKTLEVLRVFKEQGLVLVALLGLSAFFSMAETSITMLWPWKVLLLILDTERFFIL